MNNILQINNLQVSYLHQNEEEIVLNDISLDIKKGDTIAVLGETGSGKSSLAKALIGLVPNVHSLSSSSYKLIKNDSSIELNFKKNKSFEGIRGSEVGIVFQEARAHLNPTMSCGKQLMESFLLFDKEGCEDIVSSALTDIGFEDPERILKTFPHQLSGGECQRVLLVMATLQHPSILILDEPTSSLDKPIEQKVLEYLQELKEKHQTTILFITHDITIAKKIADRIIVLEKGKIADDFNTKEENDLSQYAQKLFDSWNQLHTQALVKEVSPKEEILIVDNLTVEHASSFGRSLFFKKKKTVVHDISFKLYQGEVLGIFGNSGSGKTSLANAICGLITPTSGKVKSESQNHIGMVFQNADLSLDPLQKIGNAIKEVLSKHEKSNLIEKTKELFDLVKLPMDLYNKKPNELSGGQKQRVCIARVLASKAKIIIFDEATASLDPPVKLKILQLLKTLKNNLSLTYIFITHELAVINFVTNRMLIMHNGSIIEEGQTASIVKNPTHPVAKALILHSGV